MAEPSSPHVSDRMVALVAIQQLPDQHREILVRAIHNVLSSPIAEITYGEIIDGLPLGETATDAYNRSLCPCHPLMQERVELSPGVIEKAQKLHSEFQPALLTADPNVLNAYQKASPGSRAFHTRLIELVAVAVHQIAAWLFKQEPVLTKDHELVAWRPNEEKMKVYYPRGFPVTFFRHDWYDDHGQYPDGIADQVGYWAEARILGGVVLFDRRTPGSRTGAEPDAVYFHADRDDVTYRIFRLTDEQKHQLVRFLLSESTPPPNCPLPIMGDNENRVRIDPEEPMESTGIYRDIWERRYRGLDEGDARLRTVMDEFNYVTWENQMDSWRRARTKK